MMMSDVMVMTNEDCADADADADEVAVDDDDE